MPPRLRPLALTVLPLPAFLSMKLAVVALTVSKSPLTMPANVAPDLLTVAPKVASYVRLSAVKPLTAVILALAISAVTPVGLLTV